MIDDNVLFIFYFVFFLHFFTHFNFPSFIYTIFCVCTLCMQHCSVDTGKQGWIVSMLQSNKTSNNFSQFEWTRRFLKWFCVEIIIHHTHTLIWLVPYSCSFFFGGTNLVLPNFDTIRTAQFWNREHKHLKIVW